MAKRQKQPTKTCADCIHESACIVWTDGRAISDAFASQCPSHETVKESGVYLCGVLDERKRKQTNADRFRAMSDEELCDFLYSYKFFEMCKEGCGECSYQGECVRRLMEWLKQPVE